MVLVAYHFGKLSLTGNASTFAEYGDPELLSKENNNFVELQMGFDVNIHQGDAIGYDLLGDGRDESPNLNSNSIEMPTSNRTHGSRTPKTEDLIARSQLS